MQQMICGNTQAEIERDIEAKEVNVEDRADYYHDLNYEPDFNDSLKPFTSDDIQAQIDHYERVVEQLLDASPVADRSGLKHWLPAWLDEQQWAKDLRAEKGLPLLVLYKLGDLTAEQLKLIKREAQLLASIIVG